MAVQSTTGRIIAPLTFVCAVVFGCGEPTAVPFQIHALNAELTDDALGGDSRCVFTLRMTSINETRPVSFTWDIDEVRSAIPTVDQADLSDLGSFIGQHTKEVGAAAPRQWLRPNSQSDLHHDRPGLQPRWPPNHILPLELSGFATVRLTDRPSDRPSVRPSVRPTAFTSLEIVISFPPLQAPLELRNIMRSLYMTVSSKGSRRALRWESKND